MGPRTVARGPVPRDLSGRPQHGEGQALALRDKGGLSPAKRDKGARAP